MASSSRRTIWIASRPRSGFRWSPAGAAGTWRLDAIARDLVDWSILNDQDVAAGERAAYVAEPASVLRRLSGLLGVFDVAEAVDPVDVAALAAATAVTDIRDPADAAAVAAILREPLVDARKVGRAARRHRTRS